MDDKFTVPGTPVGKARPYFVRRGAYTGAFTPARTVRYEQEVRIAYITACGNRRHEGVLCIIIAAFFRPPKGISKATRAGLFKGRWMCKKPDVDNIAKAVMDGLTGVAYNDDNQVALLLVSKEYAEEPRIEVTVRDINAYIETWK